MQLVSSRIWTRVAVSISYDDNHYTTGSSRVLIIIIKISYLFIFVIWNHINSWKRLTSALDNPTSVDMS